MDPLGNYMDPMGKGMMTLLFLLRFLFQDPRGVFAGPSRLIGQGPLGDPHGTAQSSRGTGSPGEIFWSQSGKSMGNPWENDDFSHIFHMIYYIDIL